MVKEKTRMNRDNGNNKVLRKGDGKGYSLDEKKTPIKQWVRNISIVIEKCIQKNMISSDIRRECYGKRKEIGKGQKCSETEIVNWEWQKTKESD